MSFSPDCYAGGGGESLARELTWGGTCLAVPWYATGDCTGGHICAMVSAPLPILLPFPLPFCLSLDLKKSARVSELTL